MRTPSTHQRSGSVTSGSKQPYLAWMTCSFCLVMRMEMLTIVYLPLRSGVKLLQGETSAGTDSAQWSSYASAIAWQAKWWLFSSRNLTSAKGKQSDNARRCPMLQMLIKGVEACDRLIGGIDDLEDESHVRWVWNQLLWGLYNVSFVSVQRSKCDSSLWPTNVSLDARTSNAVNHINVRCRVHMHLFWAVCWVQLCWFQQSSSVLFLWVWFRSLLSIEKASVIKNLKNSLWLGNVMIQVCVLSHDSNNKVMNEAWSSVVAGVGMLHGSQQSIMPSQRPYCSVS